MMSRTILLSAAMLLGIFLIWDIPVFAQTAKPTGQLSTSGNGQWVVIKADLNDFTDNGDIVVADYDLESQAQARAQSLNAQLKGSEEGKFLFAYQKRRHEVRKPVGDAGIHGAGIGLSDPKASDLEMPTSSVLEGTSLAGMKGEGRIGKSAVTMRFRADSELVIAGELAGKGHWSQTGPGTVKMETAGSVFRGRVNGGTATGVRFRRDNSQSLTEWNVLILPAPPEVVAQTSSLAGTIWSGKYWRQGDPSQDQRDIQIDFLEGGRFVQFTNIGEKSEGTYYEAGTSVTLRFQRGDVIYKRNDDTLWRSDRLFNVYYVVELEKQW